MMDGQVFGHHGHEVRRSELLFGSVQPPCKSSKQNSNFCLFVFQGCTHGIWRFPVQGVESEPSLPAYATATWDPSHFCDLHHSSRQCWILNPVSEAGGQGSNPQPHGYQSYLFPLCHNGNSEQQLLIPFYIFYKLKFRKLSDLVKGILLQSDRTGPQLLGQFSSHSIAILKGKKDLIFMFQDEKKSLQKRTFICPCPSTPPPPLSKGCQRQASTRLIYLFIFVFQGSTSSIGRFPGQGCTWSCSCRPTPEPQQCGIQVVFSTYITAHGNSRSLTH